ncbi:RIKEN cDNA 1700029I15, partial [Mus musculus]
ADSPHSRDWRQWFSPCLGLCTPGLDSVSSFFTSSWQAHSFDLSPRGLSNLFRRNFQPRWNCCSLSQAWWMTMGSDPSTRGQVGPDPFSPRPSSASGTGPTWLTITMM